MCGRFVLFADARDIEKHFDVFFDAGWPANYNVAPHTKCPILIHKDGHKHWSIASWGFMPNWLGNKQPLIKPINARLEEIEEKPYFLKAFQQKRCLIPANGLYEWTEEAGRKQPYFIHLQENQLFAFAGIWESALSASGEIMESFAILTHQAPPWFQRLHDRFPVIVEKNQYGLWLTDGQSMLQELRQGPDWEGYFSSYKVTPLMSKPSFNGPDCIVPHEGS